MLSSSKPDDEHISRNDRILKGDRIHFFNGAGERTKVPEDLRIRTFEYNITRTRTEGNPPVRRQVARRLCSNRNAREKENQIDSAAHQALCPGDRQGTQQKTRESHEKTEEVKPKQHASWNWKPRQKW